MSTLILSGTLRHFADRSLHMAHNCASERLVDKNGRTIWGEQKEELKENGGQ